MKKALLAISSYLAMVAFSTSAFGTIYQDTYWGADDNGYGDRIGRDHYEIFNAEVTFSDTYMHVVINTNFSEANDYFNISYGDLFISVDGWAPFGDAPYAGDNATNGENWEFVFDTSAGALYGGDFGIYLSDDVMGPYTYRNGQEVLRSEGGTEYSGSTVNLLNAGYDGFIEYNILLSSLGISSDSEIGLKWGMTCANDTIEVGVNVPEPGSLLMFGLGILGLGIVSRRKKFLSNN